MSTWTQAIAQRYDGLAAQPRANLSCGGAADLVDARPGDVCLDLGCGRGRDLVRLAAKVGPTGHAWGVDASGAMVDAARRLASESNAPNVTVVQSSLEALAVPDASVDWVVSNCALNHARDKAQVWREIARVLKPGGRFVVSDIFAVEPIAPQFRDDPEAVAQCWAGAVTRDEYLSQVAAAGLAGVSTGPERAPYRKGEALLSSFTLSGHRPPAATLPAESTNEEVMR